ncbi:hypothetical protein Rhal01_01664 [Rubritalea halochordaticola]|uniref:Surface carbohydrate biosynthesis protein n=1 Tax=Rubritalea halochordaticola TaxID=714537 RepID=A0ABP9V0N0_9BACT
MAKHSVVILIDHKGRDLMGASLIGHHLEKLGIQTHLEPLESWRAVMTAWKPSMIIFNHLTSKLIADYTENLKHQGILTAALLNEGLCLTEDNRKFHSQPQHGNLHCDLFLAWNQKHAECLKEHSLCSPPENAIPIGVPRFDFYTSPWSQVYQKSRIRQKTHILLNTTFAIAHFYHRSEKEQEMLYTALGGGKIAATKDYKKLIKAHHDGMMKLPSFIRPLLDSGNYTITLRPHPREELSFYEDFISNLSKNQQDLIKLDKTEPIPSAIINADIILNCEDCTTSVESWIANKPTLTLTFEKDPVFFTSTYADRSPQVDTPDQLIPMIEQALANPAQEEYAQLRKEYLETWIYRPDGKSAVRAAQAIARVLAEKKPVPRPPKDFSSLRRGAKLRLLRFFNEPSHARIQHVIKRHLFGEKTKQSIKYRDYLKAPRPSEERAARAAIRAAEQAS